MTVLFTCIAEQTLEVRAVRSTASKLTAAHSCTVQGYLLLFDIFKPKQAERQLPDKARCWGRSGSGEAALLPCWEEVGVRMKGSIGFFQKRDGCSDFFFFFFPHAIHVAATSCSRTTHVLGQFSSVKLSCKQRGEIGSLCLRPFRRHGIIESLRLEKTSEIIESNRASAESRPGRKRGERCLNARSWHRLIGEDQDMN